MNTVSLCGREAILEKAGVDVGPPRLLSLRGGTLRLRNDDPRNGGGHDSSASRLQSLDEGGKCRLGAPPPTHSSRYCDLHPNHPTLQFEETMSTLPRTDTDRFALVNASLYTAVIGDILDTLGRVHQFLPAEVRALLPTMKVAGRAMPVLIADVFATPAKPFGQLTEALDALQPGDVYLTRRGGQECAAWGEILTAAARSRGAVGAVVDSYHRDTHKVLEQDFPVFSRGAYGQDSSARAIVLDYGVGIEIGGVSINPGDLVIGDVDGVVVIPTDLEDEVLERALVKASTENLVREAIERGMGATEAFATYGVL